MIQSIIDQQDAEINNLRADLAATEALLAHYREEYAAAIEAIKAFRRESMLGKLTRLRGTTGYSGLFAVTDTAETLLTIHTPTAALNEAIADATDDLRRQLAVAKQNESATHEANKRMAKELAECKRERGELVTALTDTAAPSCTENSEKSTRSGDVYKESTDHIASDGKKGEGRNNADKA